nr:hypothetical protein [Tanacetum cinerariifolium]
MHNMRKTTSELHTLLIEYEIFLPKKAATPQVMAIQSDRIQKANKKSQKAKGKGSQRIKKAGTRSSMFDYALESVAYILNMVLTKKVDKTPYELWYGKVPNLWGCEALVKRDTFDKLQQRSVKCIFIGYPKETIVSGRAGDLEEIQDEDISPSKNTSEIPMEVEGFKPPHKEEAPVRRSARAHRAPEHLCLNVEVEEHSLWDLNEPANYKAVMLDSESNKWLDAMNAKMQSMKDNQVWRLVNLHPNCKTVGKMFLPVADIKAIRILISIAVYYDYEIWKIDVKTAFLNGYLDEDIYMVQPEGEAIFILGIKIYRDRSKRLIGLSQYDYMDEILKEVDEHTLGDLNEPTNYKASMLDPKSDKWFDAMNAEMKSMKDNQVWRLVDLRPNRKTVGRKWLFKKKTDMDGIVYTYKARLVAKDYTQTYGVDYEETFSPVADIRAIRILIAKAAFYDYRYSKWMSKLPFK